MQAVSRVQKAFQVVLCVLAVAGVGCGDDSGDSDGSSGSGGSGGGAFNAGTDPQRNQVMPGELCDRLATIQCAGEAFCCDAPGRDQDECYETMLAGCEDELYLDDIAEAESSGFDEPYAATAFTEFEALAASCDPSIARFGYDLNGLRGMMKGTVSANGSCTPPGFPALIPSNTMAAVALASCANAATSACVPAVSLWRCKGLSAEGGDCFTDVNCQTGLYCDNPNLTLSAECKPRLAPGEACELPNECTSLACRDGVCATDDDVQAAYCLR
jgi:hypothetical protein